MIIARLSNEAFGEEFFAKGETVEEALEALNEITDVDFLDVEFFEAQPIEVTKKETYEILR